MRRKLLLIPVFLILLFCTIFYLYLSGDIPGFIKRDDIEYVKTLDIQPSFGRIWCASSLSRDPTYYYRLHLSQTDFDATDIVKLRRSLKAEELGGKPIWWRPSNDAQCFVGPRKRTGSDYYFYDARRKLLWAICEL